MTQFSAATVAAVGAFLFLAMMHFAVDRLRRGRPMHRLWCYVSGVGIIYVAFFVWSLCYGHPECAVALGCIIGGAGLGTLASWGVDWIAARLADTDELDERRKADEAD